MSEEFKEAEGWKPEPGDVVTGKLQDVIMIEGGYGPYPMLTLERADGTEVNVHAFHDVLRSELVRKRPQPGDELTIKYLGKTTGKGNNKNGYHSYRVKGGQAQVNWGAIDDGGTGEPDVPIASADLPTPPPTPAPVTVPDDNEPLPF